MLSFVLLRAATENSLPARPAAVNLAIHKAPAASLRGGAAVDDQAGTGHEAGIVRGEK